MQFVSLYLFFSESAGGTSEVIPTTGKEARQSTNDLIFSVAKGGSVYKIKIVYVQYSMSTVPAAVLLWSHSGRERQMFLVSVSRDLAVRTIKSYSNVPWYVSCEDQ